MKSTGTPAGVGKNTHFNHATVAERICDRSSPALAVWTEIIPGSGRMRVSHTTLKKRSER